MQKNFLEISGIGKHCSEKFLKLSESRGIAKKNCCGNFKELSKNFEGHLRNLEENQRKNWRKFMGKFEDVFEKISGNL